MANYLKLAEVAHRLGISERTARRYVRAGELPSVFVGNSYRVRAEDLERYLEAAKVHPGGGSGKAQAPLPFEDAGGRGEEQRRSIYNSDEEELLHRNYNWEAMLSGALDRAKRIEQQMREAEPSTRPGGKERDEIMALLVEYRVAGGARGSSELEAARTRLWQVMESIDRMLVQKIHDPLSSEQWRNISRFRKSNRDERTAQPYKDSQADHA